MLLEAVLLRHQPALLVALDVASLCPHLVKLPVEYLVFPQFALQRAIEEGYAQRGLQANLVKTLLAITEHPGVIAHELVLEPLAQGLVQAQQVGGGDALAIGRVGHHDALLLGLREVLDVPLLQGDILREPGRAHILGGQGYDVVVDVIAIDVVLKGLLGRVIIVDAVEEFPVKVGPLLEGILAAIHSGRNAAGYHGRLDEDGAAAAHGVHQVTLAPPSRLQDDAGGQHLVDGGLHGGLAPPALVQALARRVQREGAVVLCHMDVQLHVGVGDTYVGTLASLLAELVHDGVLHLVSHKLAVPELVAVYHAVHRKGGVIGQILAPVYLPHGLIHLVGGLGTEVLDGLQHAHGGTQGEVGPVEHLLVTGKRHHAPPRLNVVGAQRGQLLSQYSLQSLEGLGYHFKFHLYVLYACCILMSHRPP